MSGEWRAALADAAQLGPRLRGGGALVQVALYYHRTAASVTPIATAALSTAVTA